MKNSSTEPRYRVEYDNDVGPGDDGFWEWWAVRDFAKPKRPILIAKFEAEDDAVAYAAWRNLSAAE